MIIYVKQIKTSCVARVSNLNLRISFNYGLSGWRTCVVAQKNILVQLSYGDLDKDVPQSVIIANYYYCVGQLLQLCVCAEIQVNKAHTIAIATYNLLRWQLRKSKICCTCMEHTEAILEHLQFLYAWDCWISVQRNSSEPHSTFFVPMLTRQIGIHAQQFNNLPQSLILLPQLLHHDPNYLL